MRRCLPLNAGVWKEGRNEGRPQLHFWATWYDAHVRDHEYDQWYDDLDGDGGGDGDENEGRKEAMKVDHICTFEQVDMMLCGVMLNVITNMIIMLMVILIMLTMRMIMMIMTMVIMTIMMMIWCILPPCDPPACIRDMWPNHLSGLQWPDLMMITVNDAAIWGCRGWRWYYTPQTFFNLTPVTQTLHLHFWASPCLLPHSLLTLWAGLTMGGTLVPLATEAPPILLLHCNTIPCHSTHPLSMLGLWNHSPTHKEPCRCRGFQ